VVARWVCVKWSLTHRRRRHRSLWCNPRLHGLLELVDSLKEDHRLPVLRFDLPPKLLVLLLHPLDLLTQAPALNLLGLSLPLLASCRGGTVTSRVIRLAFSPARRTVLRVDPAQMLVEILESGEPFAGVTFAVWMRAVERVLRAAVFAVDLPLVPEKPSRVCESGQLLAPLSSALVGPIMLVHMFTRNKC